MRSDQIVKVAAAPIPGRKKSLPRMAANGVQFQGINSSTPLGNTSVIKKSVISVLTAANATENGGTNTIT